MNLWAELKFRLRALFRRSSVERELDDELRFHIDREIEKHMRAGATRAEAERRARIEFGGLERIKDDARDERGVGWIDAVRQDLRYAWRVLRARPGFTFGIVLTLGLGVGANAAMFGVVDRLLFRPPAYLIAPDLVQRAYVHFTWNGAQRTDRSLSYQHYLDLRERTQSFDRVAAFSTRELAVGTGEATRELTVATVSASLFDFFSARPVLGRFFSAEEDVLPAGRRVLMLGYGYWQSTYGGRRDIIGEQLHVDEATYTIVGVAPRGFVGFATGPEPALFLPITAYAYSAEPGHVGNYSWSWLDVAVRRKPNVSVEAAAADANRWYAYSWDAERALNGSTYPSASDSRAHAQLASLHLSRGPEAGPEARIVVWVMGVALIVLLIACANVINLLLARAVYRRREIALRLALGVSRRRLLQQLLTEALLLALLGGVAGLIIAQIGGDVLSTLFLYADSGSAVATDVRTLLFTMLLTLSLVIITGLAPALLAMRGAVAETLRAGSRTSTYRSSRLRTGLLLFQAALSVVLLIGAGLFVRSLANVRAYRLGYDVDPLVIVDAALRDVQLDVLQRNALHDRLLEAARTVPGVQHATLAVSVPFWSTEGRGAPFVPGVDSVARLGRFMLQAGSREFFATLGTRIIRGRGFNETDVANAPPVIVVSDAMADALWPGEDVIGKRLRFGDDSEPMLTVVGVAENVRAMQPGPQPEFWYYLPVEQHRAHFGNPQVMLFVRVAGAARDYAEPIRERLQREMPGAAYVRTAPMRQLVEPRQRAWRVGAVMFAAFGVLALILAAIGLYSVCAYAVAERTRELGVRIALGASVSDVVRLIARQGALFAGAGIVLGVAVAWIAARWLQPLLFSASARDPFVYIAVAAVLSTVALIATLRPALRATRVDPTITLRTE